jgi:hypothetical protein
MAKRTSYTIIKRARCTTSRCARRSCGDTRNSRCVCPVVHGNGGPPNTSPLFVFFYYRNRLLSLLMDRSRQSLERWDDRRWSYSSRGSSRCGLGSGISNGIQNSATASVRSFSIVPLHPLHKSIGSLVDDFILEHLFLKDCAPFVLAHPYLIPSADYSKNPPPPSLALYVRSRLRAILSPLPPATPGEPSPITARPGGNDIFASSMNATREAMEATGHAFVTIGASMNVRKWNWPGYLTFGKGGPPRTVPQDQPADDEGNLEGIPTEAIPDGVEGGSVSLGPEAGLRGEVDTESLHEAMSTDGRELPHITLPSEEGDGSAVDSTSQTEETRAVVDVPPQVESDSVQDGQDPSTPSPSTPIVHPPELTSPPSLSSSQSSLPAPVPPPSFRSFSLHFPSHDPLASVQRRVLYITVSEHS